MRPHWRESPPRTPGYRVDVPSADAQRFVGEFDLGGLIESTGHGQTTELRLTYRRTARSAVRAKCEPKGSNGVVFHSPGPGRFFGLENDESEHDSILSRKALCAQSQQTEFW